MKIDTDPTTPQTPEQKPSQSQAPSEPPRSTSRVTINVRTPSRPLEAIPSSPPSPGDRPSVREAPAAATATRIDDDDVKTSVEEEEVEMLQEEKAVDTPRSSGSSASSPPIEVISEQLDNDPRFDAGENEVTIMETYDQGLLQDPTADFPYRQHSETLPDTVTKLVQYLPTRMFPAGPSQPQRGAACLC